jgi:hypothetical protein
MGLAWCVIIAKQSTNSNGKLLGEPFVRRAHSSELNMKYVEELIALVYFPSKEFHDFPPRKVTLAQQTTGDHSHQLDSMRFSRIVVRCRPGMFQASRKEHYEERLLQESWK